MDIALRYTTTTGPGGAAAQSVPGQSLGGFAATTPWGGGVVHDLFNRASSVDAESGRGDYRCLYALSGTDSPRGVRAFVRSSGGGPAERLAVGIDPRPVTPLDSLAPQAVTTSTAYAPPPGVTFYSPSDYAAGLRLGDLAPGRGRALWLKRTPGPAAGPDEADLVLTDAAGAAVVRRVLWDVEARSPAGRSSHRPHHRFGAAPEDDELPPVFFPTGNPFRQVAVDYLTAGGGRITWVLDRDLTDAGPYTFQLQSSRAGFDGAEDWIDVGDPTRDALSLTDTTQTLTGMTADLFYRVVLTTAAATYTSGPAPVSGTLTVYDWLLAQEVLRKEELYLRGLVRRNGVLLKALRYGPPCSCVDPVSGEINDSSHLQCFGTGIIGGYHAPLASWYATVDPTESYERVDYNEGRGTVKDYTTKGRFLGTVPPVHRDVWVAAGSDERFYVGRVVEKAVWQGVPLVLEAELRLAARRDVIYQLPAVAPAYAPPRSDQPVTIVL